MGGKMHGGSFRASLLITSDSKGCKNIGIVSLNVFIATLRGVLTAELKDRVFSCEAGGAQGTGVDALGIYPDIVPPTPAFQLML
eukprot:scaffold218945_cov13-Tisochrysis_lutea.AAC.1